MFESRHGDRDVLSRQPSRERDVKIEELLLLGLGHYFKGRYERAIEVWTRVLLLDKGHKGARAYIERARSALAERLRESEELFHTGLEAFNRGDVDEARVLLTSAAESGGGRDEALGLLDRLDRLRTASGEEGEKPNGLSLEVDSQSRKLAVDSSVKRHGVLVFPLVLLFVVISVSVYAALFWERWSPVVGGTQILPVTGPVLNQTGPLQVPSPAAMTLVRARRFVEEGRYQASLELLRTINPGDKLKPEADALRTTIQRALLATGKPEGTLGTTPVG